MISYLDNLCSQRKTPNVVWHKLRTSLKTKKFDFYVAFEGEEDEEFYSRFLGERFPERKFRPVICDGKGGVLALHDKMISVYGDVQNVFFFVDSDHDRFIDIDNYPEQTYSTCGYSIENYIYDEDVVIRGINKHFQLNSSDNLCKKILKSFKKDRVIFEARAKDIMTYAVVLRMQNRDPKLDKLDFNELFEYDQFKLKVKNKPCKYLLKLAGASPVNSDEISTLYEKFDERNVNEYIRGKLVAQFILNFCRKLARQFSGQPKLNGKPLISKFDFSKKNLISTFVDFVELPARLSAFMEGMNSQICENDQQLERQTPSSVDLSPPKRET